MATATGPVLTEGHWAEQATVSLLNSAGFEAVASTPAEDHRLKVDLWCRRQGEDWIPVQLSTCRSAIAGEKGMNALRKGVAPNFVEGEALEAAFHNPALAEGLTSEFWSRVDQIRAAFRPRLIQPRRPLP